MAIIKVPTDQPNLVAAVGVANPNDEIVVEDGTYTGANNKNVDPGGVDPLTIRSENGNAVCIIDCEYSGRAFYIHNGEQPTCVIDGFTITHGAPGSYVPGGAIYIYNYTDPIIQNCVFIGNSARYASGGAINITSYCTAQILNCIFTGNYISTAGNSGGAISVVTYSSSTIKDCVFDGNCATKRGGAIFVYSSNPLIHTCLFINNYTNGGGSQYGGGGICCQWYASPTIRTSTFYNNYGSCRGGAILSTQTSNPIAYDSIFWGNGATYGDDAYGYSPGSVRLTYCDFQEVEGSKTIVNCISVDPCFVTGLWGDYPDYFLNSDADAGADSPCINAGSQTAEAAGVDDRSTRTDKALDTGTVDMGYHYLPPDVYIWEKEETIIRCCANSFKMGSPNAAAVDDYWWVEVETCQGESYYLWLWYKCTAYTDGYAYLQIWDATNDVQIAIAKVVATTSVWEKLQHKFVIPANCVKIEVRYGGHNMTDSAIVYWDCIDGIRETQKAVS